MQRNFDSNTTDSILSTTPKKVSTRQKSSLSKVLMMASTVPLSSMAVAALATDNNESVAPSPSTVLPAMQIYDTANTAYKKDYLQNTKFTQELVDTPQTITVITEALIEEQKATSLVNALRNTPGITMQLGENGRSSEGDAISLRGFSGDDLFLVDGVRNIAPVSRDTFNIEAVEVIKGTAGAELGRAATGGAINLVTKKPKAITERAASISIDTEAKTRVSADLNQPLAQNVAGRVNVMYENGDAVGRNEVSNESWGIAPSVTWGLGMPLQVTASAELLSQRNTPEGGIPTVGMEGYYGGRTNYTVDELDFSELDYTLISASTPEQAVADLNAANRALNTAPRINEENYYGDSEDHEDVDSGILSLYVEYDIDADTHLSNTTRYSQTEMKRELSAPYNAYNSPLYIGRRTNKLLANEDLAALNIDPSNLDTWRIRTIRQGVDRTNTTVGNLTNINLYNVITGSLTHDFSTGFEVLQERQENKSMSRPEAIDYPSLYHPNPRIPQGKMTYNGSTSEGQTITIAGYVFDTLSVTDNIQVLGGVRIDSYETTYDDYDVEDGNTSLKDSGTLVSYKGAAVFKPTTHSSVYANYSHAETPPGSSNFSLSNTGWYGGSPSRNPIFDPQTTDSWELGTKWQLLNEHLSMTLAYYNTTHKDELSEEGADGNYVQLGERTIDGIEIATQGEILPNWHLNLGIQTMETEITEGTTGRSAEGASARWSPELTGTLWSSYTFADRVTVGGGVRYVGEQTRQTDPEADLSITNMPEIPEYWVVDAFASYQVTDGLSTDLNIYNVFDEDYIDTLNNGGARVIKGEPINAMLTLKYQF